MGFCGIGNSGLINAAILACQIIGQAAAESPVLESLSIWRRAQAESKPPFFDIDLRKLVAVQKRREENL